MRRLSVFVIAGIIALVIFIGVNSVATLTSPPEPSIARLQLNYDAYAEGINTVLYDALGNINYTLQADRQVHFNDDSTELDKPFIRLYENGNSRWNIVANSGRISPLYTSANGSDGTHGQTIELSGDIEVYSLDLLGNRTQMTTDFLTVNPDTKIMETDRLVTLVTDSMQLTSTGMYADLQSDAVVFNQDTRGNYDPSTK